MRVWDRRWSTSHLGNETVFRTPMEKGIRQRCVGIVCHLFVVSQSDRGLIWRHSIVVRPPEKSVGQQQRNERTLRSEDDPVEANERAT
jgi:hypothetical protein